MKRRGSRSLGTTVIGGKRPREGEPCWYCQTVRARRARSEGAAQANQWWTLLAGLTPKPFSSSGGEATVKACGVAVAMLPE